MTHSRHILLEVDSTEGTGICTHCGKITLRRFQNGWRCILAPDNKSQQNRKALKIAQSTIVAKPTKTKFVHTYGGHPTKLHTSVVDACMRDPRINRILAGLHL